MPNRNPIYEDVKKRFEGFLENHFDAVKAKQTPESLVVLIMIWTTEGYRAVTSGDYKAAVENFKEARNWLDQFIDRISK